MNFSKYINYTLLIIGCTVAIYAQAGKEQDVMILIMGIVILMFGLFRITSSIPSKREVEKDSHITHEDDV